MAPKINDPAQMVWLNNPEIGSMSSRFHALPTCKFIPEAQEYLMIVSQLLLWLSHMRHHSVDLRHLYFLFAIYLWNFMIMNSIFAFYPSLDKSDWSGLAFW